jgi:drug/metabolite transporter (DMT)-like permease
MKKVQQLKLGLILFCFIVVGSLVIQFKYQEDLMRTNFGLRLTLTLVIAFLWSLFGIWVKRLPQVGKWIESWLQEDITHPPMAILGVLLLIAITKQLLFGVEELISDVWGILGRISLMSIFWALVAWGVGLVRYIFRRK